MLCTNSQFLPRNNLIGTLCNIKMTKKTHTTNYQNTFIEVAEDCPLTESKVPEPKGNKPTNANLQFEMLSCHPYKFTSDDVLFAAYATRKDIPENEWKSERDAFFSKGQACLRASPLTKSYGWGIHSDEAGRIALYGMETEKYKKFLEDGGVKKLKAMRSKKAG